MKQEALKYFTDTHYTIAAFIIFFIVFTVIAIWAYRKSAKSTYDRMSRLPLDNSNEGGAL